jgi:hypothetical protein
MYHSERHGLNNWKVTVKFNGELVTCISDTVDHRKLSGLSAKKLTVSSGEAVVS